jgi:diacylglycerol kinase (ATP)
MQRVGVLVNPSSGRGRVARQADRVLAGLGSRGAVVVPIIGRSAGEAESALAAEVSRGVDTIVAVGGDGTVHMALQAAAGTSMPLGIIPLGTGNDAAAALGIPSDPAAAVATVLAGHRRAFDVGVARTDDGVERRFLCVLSSGFDSMVNERANRMRWPSGGLRYVLAMLAELRTFRPIDYRAEVDGSARHARAMFVSLGNGPSYGGGMQVCAHADLHDGLLSMVWVHPISRPALLRIFPSVYSGAHLAHPAVQDEAVRSARLYAAGQVAYADGERIGPLPVTVSTVPDGVRVLVPR